MLYTPLYYDKNNYERKEDEISGHIRHGGLAPCHGPPYHVLVAPPVALRRSTPYPPWWGVLSSSSTLVGPPLPVITHMPPYEQLLVAEGSGAVGVIVSPLSLSSSCSALAELVLVLVPLALALVLASSSSFSPPSPPPSCSASSWRW